MSLQQPITAPAPATLAPGWDEEDVAWLREMAALGMELAREVVAEVREHRAAREAAKAEASDHAQVQAPAMTPAAVLHAELRFSRITRAVRLALSLKARARGAEVPAAAAAATAGEAARAVDPLWALGPPFNPVFSDTPLEEPGFPGTDPSERITFRAGEIRRELAHVFEAPDREAADVERLWDVAEDHIDRARANPAKFVVSYVEDVVEAICKDLDIPFRRHELRDHRGWTTGHYIARPDEPDSPPVLTELPPVTDFMLSRRRWRRAKPP